MVLDHPEIPLHTNGSENDIRCQVTKRQVSGGTKTDTGRDCRDAFLGLGKDLPQARHLFLGLPRRQARRRRHPPSRASPTSSAAAVSPPDTRPRPGFCPGYRFPFCKFQAYREIFLYLRWKLGMRGTLRPGGLI